MWVVIDSACIREDGAAGLKLTESAGFDANRASLRKLEERAFTTYRARLKARDRLVARNVGWNAALVAIATATTVVSIVQLSGATLFGPRGNVLFVALSVLSLVLSLVVSNANFGARAAMMELSYKRIQTIATSAQEAADKTANDAAKVRLWAEYNVALETSENHTTADYGRSKPGAVSLSVLALDSILTRLPLVMLLVPAGLLLRVGLWFFGV